MAGRRRITEAQLKALARGRRTAAANRRKKKAPVRRNPMFPKQNPRRPAGGVTSRGLYSTIRLHAPNDSNGNPRRVFVSFRAGEPVGVFDEGYSGVKSITDAKMRAGFQGISIAISPGEYKEWLAVHKVGRDISHNPAHGNFLNAIAAKERGGLGREAFQNPAYKGATKRDPHGARHHSPTGVPRLLVAGVVKGQLKYLGPFGWTTKNTAMSFNTANEARTAANKTRRKSAVVLPAHTAAEIRAALRKRS